MAEEFVRVSVRTGALKGRRRRTEGGQSFHSFEGVPYAKPPTGPLRFKSPEPAESWEGIRDATKAGKPCVHFDLLADAIVGSEDCLYLNVYTPDLPSERREVSLPVMVWIHGGGFAVEYGDIYGPQPFMDKGVVVVTFNYRLGPLGFLSLGTLDVPGNAGLKDQTLALRWVQENIAVFGGDPGNVTIFGEDAGAISVHYQLLSPLTKGLFHRVIAMSGSAFNPWALVSDPVARARSLAVATGCDPREAQAEDPSALAAWLRGAPAEALVDGVRACVSDEDTLRGDIVPFVPCVEPAHAGAFLPREPRALLAAGHVPRLPVLLGVTAHEGIFYLPGVFVEFTYMRAPPGGHQIPLEERQKEEAWLMAEISARPELLLPKDLPALQDPNKKPQLIQRLKDFYFNGQQPSMNTLEEHVDVISDTQVNLGVLRAARDLARHGSPVYLYEYAYRGSINYISTVFLKDKVKGVAHGDELNHMFDISGLPLPTPGSQEELVKRRMIRMWTDFAKEGNPTPSLDELINVNWPVFSETAPNYLKITEELKSDTHLFKDRMLFWKDLYNK